jgi:hypothetical protein
LSFTVKLVKQEGYLAAVPGHAMMSGTKSLKYEHIREELGVEPIKQKVIISRGTWKLHTERMPDERMPKQTM